MKPKQSNHKHQGNEAYHSQAQPKKRFDTKGVHSDKSGCSKCGDSVHIDGFQCPAKKYQCKACHKFGHFTSMCYQKKQAPSKHRKPKSASITGKWKTCAWKCLHMTTRMKTALQMNHFACRLRSSESKLRKTKCQRQHT